MHQNGKPNGKNGKSKMNGNERAAMFRNIMLRIEVIHGMYRIKEDHIWDEQFTYGFDRNLMTILEYSEICGRDNDPYEIRRPLSKVQREYINRLKELKVISTKMTPSDVCCRLTKKGQKFLDHFNARQRELQEEVVFPLSTAEAETINELLEKIAI